MTAKPTVSRLSIPYGSTTQVVLPFQKGDDRFVNIITSDSGEATPAKLVEAILRSVKAAEGWVPALPEMRIEKFVEGRWVVDYSMLLLVASELERITK